MQGFLSAQNLSSVTAMLPQSTAGRVLDEVFHRGGHGATLFAARGTLLRDRWFQRLIPVISPVMRYVQVLVPNEEVDGLIREIYTVGGMHRPGSGAVFSIPCEDVTYSRDYPVWSPSGSSSNRTNLNIRENLTAIYCVTARDTTESICRAAVQAGAHGPVIQLCEGQGLRSRLGWLRITRKADKEVIAVVIDNDLADEVYEAIVRASGIGAPGRGIIYRLGIHKGVVNLTSVYGHARHAASLEQIIAAIDDLKGETHWRDQSVIDLGRRGKVAGFGIDQDTNRQRHYASLICIVRRENLDPLFNALLQAGAPGVNIVYGKFSETETATTAGLRLTKERGILRTILPRKRVAALRAAIQKAALEGGIPEVCVYTQSVSRASIYIPEARRKLRQE